MRNPDPGLTSRRAFLRGVAAVAGTGLVGAVGLAGCDLFKPGGADPAADHQLDGFLAATVALGHRYDETIAALPDLTAQLTPLRDAHVAHAQALAGAIGSAVPPPQTGSGAVPADRTEALAALIAAEKAGQGDAVSACVGASARLAPLLGSIAAARASHVEVLK